MNHPACRKITISSTVRVEEERIILWGGQIFLMGVQVVWGTVRQHALQSVSARQKAFAGACAA
eukprot:3723219-Prymnesium_polylepis.1